MSTKIERALGSLYVGLQTEKLEYPDAHSKACARHRLTPREGAKLTEAFDAHEAAVAERGRQLSRDWTQE